MATKQVQNTTTRTIRTCDLCEREIGNYSHHCAVCNREFCYRCGTTLFTKAKLIDFGLHMCKECQAVKADEYGEIERLIVEADGKVKGIIDGWKQ